MTFDIISNSIRTASDRYVHESVRDDVHLCTRHRGLLVTLFIAGAIGTSIVPVVAAILGAVPLTALFTISLLILPLAIAFYLSQSGNFGTCQIFFTSYLGALSVWAAVWSGGLNSPALALIALLPMEAALSENRKTWTALITIAISSAIAAALLGPHAPAVPVVPGLAPIFFLVALGFASTIVWRLSEIRDNRPLNDTDREYGEFLIDADQILDFVSCHDVHGQTLYAAPSCKRIFGVSAKEFLNSGYFNTVHIQDRPKYLKAISDAIHQSDVTCIEFRMHKNIEGNRKTIWVEMRCQPSTNADGNEQVIAVTRDICKRREQEAALMSAREAADTANVAKSRFLANMSHELRTPLNAIIGFSEILDREMFGPIEPPRYKEYSKIIRDSSNHLLDLVNGVLDMSKIESGHYDLIIEPFILCELVENACGMLVAEADRKGVSIERQVEADLPDLMADSRACRQILLNLLSNALKFTDRGGTIRVDARSKGEKIVLSVADDGCGISAEKLPQLGRPFVQVDDSYKRNGEGTGLGLSVVKGLMELHGGGLEIESERGAGTKVTVTFPRIQFADNTDSDSSVESIEKLRQLRDERAVSHKGHSLGFDRKTAI